MIEVNVIKDFFETKKIFEDYNIVFGENCYCMSAKDGEDVLGICLFKYEEDSVIIKELQPRNDLSIIDGVLRSTFFVASNRKIEKAFYDNDNLINVFEKLDFIDNIENKSLKLKKIFDSCGCCNKN